MTTKAVYDESVAVIIQLLALRFSKDQRLSEVCRLLDSSQPARIAIPQRPGVRLVELLGRPVLLCVPVYSAIIASSHLDCRQFFFQWPQSSEFSTCLSFKKEF